MYDVIVIANFDSAKMRNRFRTLEQHAVVHYVFDRSAIVPDQFPAAICRSGIVPKTDYYFVLRGEQELLGDVRVWLRYDVPRRAIVLWPADVRGRTKSAPRAGLSLFPSDATGGHEYERIDESYSVSLAPQYPILNPREEDLGGDKLEWLRKTAREIETGYFYTMPGVSEYHRDLGELIDPRWIGPGENPILHYPAGVRPPMQGVGHREPNQTGIIMVPASFGDPTGSLDELFYHADWPSLWPEPSTYVDDYKAELGTGGCYDIIMITNGEHDADKHWKLLRDRYPHAQRLDRAGGILDAHVAAAKLARTDYFWVIDADNVLSPEARLSEVQIPYFDPPRMMVWRALNSVNGLCYGYGGVKLLPTAVVRSFEGETIAQDFAAMVADRCGGMQAIQQTWSETIIGSTPFEAWRAGYREMAKLILWLNAYTEASPFYAEQLQRYRTWGSVGKGKYGEYTLRGAKKAFELTLIGGHAYINNEAELKAMYGRDCGIYERFPEEPELLKLWSERMRDATPVERRCVW